MKTIDLFAGCGGMSLGFQRAGFEVLAAFDCWEAAVRTYKANFDHPIFNLDLSKMEARKIITDLQPEMIIGGPPCQDFSSAGKRDENGGRADLTLDFANLVADCQPEWFVMENVERILKSQVLKEAISIFKKAGFGLSWEVLDASFCGVPQSRKRFFLVGHRFSKDGFLNPYLLKNQSKRPMTIHDYLGNSLEIEHYYRHPRSYQRRGVFSIYEPSPTVRGVNRPIPKTYKKHPGDLVETLENIRPLTTIERSWLQTFPKNFLFEGSKTDLEQLIGNAVPVKLAEFVANCIQDFIADSEQNLEPKNSQLQFDYA